MRSLTSSSLVAAALLAAVVVTTPQPIGATLPASLPAVASGARPGPDVLYSAAPAAPQLENRDPRFTAPPLLVSGTEAYANGEYLYQDYLYDDYGSDTDGVGGIPQIARSGDVEYPTDRARYGNNAADLVELRIKVSPTEVVYRITLNTLLAAGTLVASAAAPAGGTCHGHACWKASGQGFRYVDKDLTPSGIRQIVLKPGLAGKAQILVKGQGANLDLPTLPIAHLPLTVHLTNSAGACFEARYPTTFRNTGDQLKAHGD